jgi:UDP-2,4-diacetamido-2,4,6-trideoxy-beta-L-altropyranose hydrolase
MKVTFRVDASIQIGTGHLSRCLNLANELSRRGAKCNFISRDMPEYFINQIQADGHGYCALQRNNLPTLNNESISLIWSADSQMSDAQQTLNLIADDIQDWIIVDHYSLDINWELGVRNGSTRLMVIDDLANRQHVCEILLDQNMQDKKQSRYIEKVDQSCKILLGPKFALLRSEFGELHKVALERSGLIRRVLIFFGGVDSKNHTIEAMNALINMHIPEVLVDVVIGLQHPFIEDIKNLCSQHNFRLHIQTKKMAELMLQSDLCIGSGGVVTWERCCLGLPSLAYAIAENQEEVVRVAALSGLIYAPNPMHCLSDSIELHLRGLLENQNILKLISINGINAVDGNGAKRVAQAMGVSPLKVRRALQADSENIFEWRNYPDVIKFSKNQNRIDYIDHCNWFNSVITNDRTFLLIGVSQGESIGVVRFDVEEFKACISIYVVPGVKYFGAGTDLLMAAEEWLKKFKPEVTLLMAEVLGENKRSQHFFSKNGYQALPLNFEKKV